MTYRTFAAGTLALLAATTGCQGALTTPNLPTTSSTTRCVIYADGDDAGWDADVPFSEFRAYHGELDYENPRWVRRRDNRTVGYSLTEDSTIWNSPNCW